MNYAEQTEITLALDGVPERPRPKNLSPRFKLRPTRTGELTVLREENYMVQEVSWVHDDEVLSDSFIQFTILGDLNGKIDILAKDKSLETIAFVKNIIRVSLYSFRYGVHTQKQKVKQASKVLLGED